MIILSRCLVLVCVGCIMFDKIISMQCYCFHRDAILFQSLQIFRVYFSDVERALLWQVPVFNEDSAQTPTQRSRIPSIRSEIPVNRLNTHQSATSIRTTKTFLLDPHKCLEALNCSRLHPSGSNGKSSGRSLELEKNPAFKRIHLDDVAIPSGCHIVFDK